MTVIIQEIDFDVILPVWKDDLWPNRQSAIEGSSAMMFNRSEYDNGNLALPKWFFGLYINDRIVGVNSGHLCTDDTARSRGLWVNEEYRGLGLGKKLLQMTIEKAKQYDVGIVWSFPRKTSWHVYASAGFSLVSPWQASETSESNAYCKIDLL